MSHDFIDKEFVYCRKVTDGAIIGCVTCANYQSEQRDQLIGPVTGHPNDCCNGFMGYYDHPHYWSQCSVRMFEQHYVSRKWNQCMDTTRGKQILRRILFQSGFRA